MASTGRTVATPARQLSTDISVRVLAKDPAFVDEDGNVRMMKVDVAGGLLEPGPRDHRFHVVDFDIANSESIGQSAVLTAARRPGWNFEDQLARSMTPRALLRHRAGHAQHVWGVASATLRRFERALGRRVSWQFPCPQLFLVPHAFPEANAYYDRTSRGVFFGYVPARSGSNVYACLSHDIVAHEVSHAVLDGLRKRYLGAALPDGLAFHEALADIVALLSTFASVETVKTQLNPQLPEGRRGKQLLITEKLREAALFGLAEELGAWYGRTGGLRRSITLEAGVDYLKSPAYAEPHRRGEILVAAMLQMFLEVWTIRITELDPSGAAYLDRASEEGTKAAEHILTMLLRSIDYLPMVDLELGDLFDAITLADEAVVPNERLSYRDALSRWFGKYGLVGAARPAARPLALTGAALDYRHVHPDALRADHSEVFRFLWQNAEEIGFNRRYYTDVESIHPVTRVGPDGLLNHETIITYSQRVEGTLAALRRHSSDALRVPRGLKDGLELELWGGGVVVFDNYGHARLHLRKPVDDWGRQNAVLRRIAERDVEARGGTSFGMTSIADLHASDDEGW